MRNILSARRPAARAFALVLAASLAALACLPGCATAPASGRVGPGALSGPLATGPFPSPSELSPFAREGLSSLSTFELSNGIPVVLRQNGASPVRHLSLVLRGGSLAAEPATAGFELLAMRTMARGSKGYSYEDITSLLDETSAAMGAAAAFEYSTYSLTALDKHFARLLPVWADTLAAPRFSEEDFAQVLSEAKLALKSREQDPWQRTGLVMNAEFFAGHPYAASPDGTKESLAAASLQAAKDWYAKSFSADRIFVVAVGDFDAEELKAGLEKALGALPDRKAGLPAPAPAFVAAGEGRLVKSEHAQSKGVGYLRGDFAAPPPSDPSYMAANVAMKMFSDLLFNVVRDEHGAAYSPSAYVRGFGANYGSVAVFKTTKAAEVKAYIDEAAAELAAGRCLSVDPARSEGGKPRMPLAEALPAYKAQFANDYYEKLQTNAAVAGLIAQSVATTGDCRSWLLDGARIAAVGPEDVARAFKAVLDSRVTWVVLGSKDVIEPVDPAAFGRLGPR